MTAHDLRIQGGSVLEWDGRSANHSVQFSAVYSVQCTVNILRCKVQRTVFSVPNIQYTLHSVQCTVYLGRDIMLWSPLPRASQMDS